MEDKKMEALTVIRKQIEEVGGDLPRALLQAFAEADERRGGLGLRRPLWAAQR